MDDESAIDLLKSKGWVLDWVRGGPGLIPPQRELDAEEERAAKYLQEQHDYVIG